MWYARGGYGGVDASVEVQEALQLSMCCPSEHAGIALMLTLVSCCWSFSGCNRGFKSCGPWALWGLLRVTKFEEVGVAEGRLYMLGNVGDKGVKRYCPSVSGRRIDVRME